MEKNKKIIYVIIGVVLLLTLIVVLTPKNTTKPSQKEALKFEEYVHSTGKVTKKFTQTSDQEQIITYEAEGSFANYTGKIILKRNGLTDEIIANSFKIALDQYDDEEQLENDTQSILKAFANYLKYDGNISHTLIPNKKQIDYDKTTLKSVIDEDAMLEFSFYMDKKIYKMDVYIENFVCYAEIMYLGELTESPGTQIPDGIQGQ